MMKNGKLLVAPALLWLSIFFVIPLLIVVAVSFAGRTPYGQVIFSFTIDNYLRFLEPLYLKIFADTLIVAVITTLATILMGYPLAYTIAQLPKKWQQPGLILVMIPFWINFLIRSYAWVIILRSQGVVNTLLLNLGLIDQPLQMLYNDMAVMLGMVYALLPFMVLPIYNTLAKIDDNVINAARDLGADNYQTLTKILLPLSVPGIVSGITMVFVPALTTFVISNLLGGSKILLIGNVIEQEFTKGSNWNLGAGLSIVLMVFILLSMTMIAKYDKDGEGSAF